GLMLTVLVISVLIAYEFNNVYVPEGLENKHAYKVTGLVMSTTGFLAKSLAWFNIGTEVSNFREILGYAIKIEELKRTEVNVKKEDRTINGIRVRVYEPKDKSAGKRPALIFYHGGGYAFGHLNTYDLFIEKILEKQELVAVSV
ncbi:hypothetical protein DAPPUDRAFT_280198, partial [Daphnia pulex]